MGEGKRLYFNEINIVKGIAMLTVIWHHSMIVYPINLQALPWCRHAMAINHTYYLIVFFLISGYLFAFSSDASPSHTLHSKVKRLLIPYLSFGAINMTVKMMAPTLVNTKVEGLGSYISKMVFYGGELWFVYTLFILFLIWSLVLQWVKRPQAGYIVIALAVIDQLLPANFLGGIFMLHEVVYYSIWFVAGWLLKDLNRDLLGRRDYFLIASVLFMFLCVIFVLDIRLPFIDAYVKGAIGCWFVWMLSFQISNLHWLARPFSFIGKYSLSYYWMNGFALVPARYLVVNVLRIEPTPAIAICIWCICVAVITIAVLAVRRIPVLKTAVGIV